MATELDMRYEQLRLTAENIGAMIIAGLFDEVEKDVAFAKSLHFAIEQERRSHKELSPGPRGIA